MKGFLRRLRGIIGTGLTWAVGWAGLWGAFLLVLRAFGAEVEWGLIPTLQSLYHVGTFGFFAGSAFGVILSVLERHKSLEEITFKRIALWGGFGGLALLALLSALSGTVITNWPPVISFTVLGVGSATGTVALAKRADRNLIEGDKDLPALEGE